MDIGPSEAESFWTAFLRKLMRRGLRGVKLVISEGGGKPSCCVPPGNAATCTSCAMRWPMPARAAGASSPPSSPPPSRGKPPRLPASGGDPWPIRCGPNSPSWQPCWIGTRDQVAQHEFHRAADRRDQAPHRGCRHLPERGRDHASDRHHLHGTERRMGCPARPLHDEQGLGEPGLAHSGQTDEPHRPARARRCGCSQSSSSYRPVHRRTSRP